MDFEFTGEQQAFRREVRDFFQGEPWGGVAPGNQASHSLSFCQRAVEEGWTGLLAPKEYGGQGKDAIYETIFAEELSSSESPPEVVLFFSIIAHCIDLIVKCATERQKKEYIPRIISGELIATQMYTEPDSGSDLASVRTTAVREGDYYLVNGQKVFTSNMDSPYSILMARTDPSAPPEKGVSLFILDNRTSGISYTPIKNLCEIDTTQVFLDNIKIPAENLLGEENKGWDYFMRTKAHYWHKARVWAFVSWQKLFDAIVGYVRETQADGQPLGKNQAVRQRIAEMAIDLKTLRLLIYRLAWMQSEGLDELTFAAALKVVGDNIFIRLADKGMQILGLSGQLGIGAGYAPLSGMMELMYRGTAIYHFADSGGAATAKNFLAVHGLGLPDLSGGDD